MDSNPNPNYPQTNSCKSTMAVHFMQALTNIQQRHETPTNSSSAIGRSRRINCAAYASMAIAAGPTRVWSQALLRRLHGGGRRVRSTQRVVLLQRRVRVRVRVPRNYREPGNRIESLRRLVPGGRTMDLCSLLDETASYVQCLRDQVTLMKSIVDSVSFN